jgi:hypothetical protein
MLWPQPRRYVGICNLLALGCWLLGCPNWANSCVPPAAVEPLGFATLPKGDCSRPQNGRSERSIVLRSQHVPVFRRQPHYPFQRRLGLWPDRIAMRMLVGPHHWQRAIYLAQPDAGGIVAEAVLRPVQVSIQEARRPTGTDTMTA